jgi:hypothetical protein
MKSYPKIEHYSEAPLGEFCYAFYKYDGSNIRAEWSKKRGWYKFGTRNVMIDINTPLFGEAITVFLDKYGEKLNEIFRSKYPKVDSFVVFSEYFGNNSFAGKHSPSDKKDIVLFDVNQYKRGFLQPREFVDNFGHLDIPKIIYQGNFNEELIKNVRENKYQLTEGVVCKGLIKTKKEGDVIWMTKIKCDSWINKIREIYGERSIIEEFNGDLEILKYYHHLSS